VCLLLIMLVTVLLGRPIDIGYLNTLILLGSFLVVLALGQGTVILTGGLDLSLPWTIGLCGILLGGLARGSNEAALWAVPLVLAIGILIGLVNGLAIVLFKLPPIVATLAMNGLLQGIALLYSNGTPDGFAPPALKWLMNARIGPFTPVVFAVIVFAALGIVLLSRTVFGRHVYAVGNSPRVAHLSGVNVGRVTMSVYALSGLCSALVGVMLTGFGGQASLGMGDPYLLPSIAVVVIGGTLITGGRGKYVGMIGGVLLLTALQTLLAGTMIPPSIRDVIYGVVILCAVVMLRERSSH
jgi:ribose transport system permease protein